MCVVTDFIDGGDLHKLWQETGSFDEDLVKIYVAEVALVLGRLFNRIWKNIRLIGSFQSIDFLHNAGIIYRDLKMENILIDSSGHLSKPNNDAIVLFSNINSNFFPH